MTYRYYFAGVLGGIAALLSCTTEPCTCTPNLSHVVVSGRVTQEGNGLSGAQLRFQEQLGPCPASDSSLIDLDVYYESPYSPGTDDSGGFTAHPYSLFGPSERCLVVSAVADGQSAGVELNARFRLDREIPDTVHVGLTLDAP